MITGKIQYFNSRMRPRNKIVFRPAAKGELGMTLPELVVGAGVGSLALMSMMMIFLSSNRSFVSMGNYVAMDQTSRVAVEQMTRDIRNSQNLTSFTTNKLVFTYAGTTNLVYSYDPSTRQLTSWKTGGSTNVLLSQCDT